MNKKDFCSPETLDFSIFKDAYRTRLSKLDLAFHYPAIFKPEKWKQLEEKYIDRFNEDVLSVLESQENQAFSPNDSEDILLF